ARLPTSTSRGLDPRAGRSASHARVFVESGPRVKPVGRGGGWRGKGCDLGGIEATPRYALTHCRIEPVLVSRLLTFGVAFHRISATKKGWCEHQPFDRIWKMPRSAGRSIRLLSHRSSPKTASHFSVRCSGGS